MAGWTPQGVQSHLRLHNGTQDPVSKQNKSPPPLSMELMCASEGRQFKPKVRGQLSSPSSCGCDKKIKGFILAMVWGCSSSWREVEVVRVGSRWSSCIHNGKQKRTSQAVTQAPFCPWSRTPVRGWCHPEWARLPASGREIKITPTATAEGSLLDGPRLCQGDNQPQVAEDPRACPAWLFLSPSC